MLTDAQDWHIRAVVGIMREWRLGTSSLKRGEEDAFDWRKGFDRQRALRIPEGAPLDDLSTAEKRAIAGL